MYILSQDKTIVIKMSGVYMQANKWTTVEQGVFIQREVERKEFAIMCVSDCEFGLDTVGDANDSYTKIYKVGSFGTKDRAKQEIESIAQAILDKEELYMIKTK